jgi:carbon-monoxide dehydrogenase medium subunit
MRDPVTEWIAPRTLEEAVAVRGELGNAVTVVAGGTFIGTLMNQGLLAPTRLLSLQHVDELRYVRAGGELRLGAMITHRTVERSGEVGCDWPALRRAFSLVASPRVRNQATVGGVLADADYASDPPAMLVALGAHAVARGPRGQRVVPVEELITGYYETSLEPDELLTEVRVPAGHDRATYRKFRSRSTEDRPCVAVAAATRDSELRIVVGAVADRLQLFEDVCALWDGDGFPNELCVEIGRRYAGRIDPIEDARGSASYRRRVISVEVRRALQELREPA